MSFLLIACRCDCGDKILVAMDDKKVLLLGAKFTEEIGVQRVEEKLGGVDFLCHGM